MVNNLKCDNCEFATKCIARNKLKPFMEDARTDLGVELDFVDCSDYKALDENNSSINND